VNVDSVLNTSNTQNNSAQPLPIGHRMGELELTGVLGIGGFGIVYRAFDHALQRVVAVKEYMPSMLATRGDDLTVTLRSERFSATFLAGRAGFINEARLLAQFDHPGLIKVLRFWEMHGTAYMATPFYEGQTLKQRLSGGRALAETEIMLLMAALLGALETLHRAQCYHRDIALDNIVIQPDGRPVLLDFGAARKLIGDLVDDNAVMLKSGYAPIEQYTDDPAFRQGPWTDLYALGAVIHVLVSGELPPAAVVRSIQDYYVPLARRALNYNPRLLQAADQALHLRVVDRPQSVAEFAVLLGLQSAAPGQYRVPEPDTAANWPAAADAPATNTATVPTPVAAGPYPDQAKPPLTIRPEDRAARQLASALPSQALDQSGPFVVAAIAQHLAAKPASGAMAETTTLAAAPLKIDDVCAPVGLRSQVEQSEQQQSELIPADSIASTARVDDAHGPDATSQPKRSKRLPWLRVAGVSVVVATGLTWLSWPSGQPRLDTKVAVADRATAVSSRVAPAIASAPPIAPRPATLSSEPASAVATFASTPTPQQPDTDAQDWTQARQRNNAESYQRYLQQHIDGTHDAEAHNLLTAATQRESGAQPDSPTSVAKTVATAIPQTVPVKLRISPWGEVYVRGSKRVVSPPVKTLSLAPGSYEIEVRNGALPPYRTRLVIPAGATSSEITYSFD
jgi:non-specific serine/threonine protein kinase